MGKKAAPTLIDALYRDTFLKESMSFGNWRSNVDMRRAFEAARRFIVDDRMGAFMADLATEAFLKRDYRDPLNLHILNSIRVSARLPHESIWIEYPLRAYQRRSCELLSRTYCGDSQVPAKEGWLIQQHPKLDTAFIMHLFTMIFDDEEADPMGNRVWTFPFAFAWMCDDNPLPWRTTLEDTAETSGDKVIHPSEHLTGLVGYVRDNVGAVSSPLITDPVQTHEKWYLQLLGEWAGCLRRVWALLATLDHLPLGIAEVRQSKGFLARGRIRKFLDHKTITLNIPAKKDPRVIARQAIAHAHRKRHSVRAHWRDDWRNPPSKRCNPHLWEFVDDKNPDLIRCDVCGGRQFLIHQHERGDASLGYVTHDYALKHEVEPRRPR